MIIDQPEVEIFDRHKDYLVFWKFSNQLEPESLDNLTKSADKLIEAFPPPIQNDKRGEYKGYFLGF